MENNKMIGFAAAALFGLSCFVALTLAAAPRSTNAPVFPEAHEFQADPADSGSVIVHPKFGGQILGYDIDRNGTEGLLSEYVSLTGGANLVATELFDQKTGAILKVVAKEKRTKQDDYVTEGIFGSLGLDLFQHAGQNHFLVINPLNAGKFTGEWTPPIKNNYQLWTIGTSQGSPKVAAYQASFGGGPTYVFRSNIAKNTFGRQISLKSIQNVDEFLFPQIALDSKTNEAVLADSLGCPEKTCVTDVALVELTTGKIRKFTAGLGIGSVDGLAVDPTTGIACTTTLVDGGVEFYDLARQTGFEVPIFNAGELEAGLDVEFDPVHKVFLVEQYTSTGNINDPQPRIYVYDEKGNVKKTVTGLQRIPISPSLIALNPGKRIGFVPVIVEPQHEFLELQSFKY